MIDTHAHLTERFKTDVEKKIEAAKAAGVRAIILAASSLKDSEENLELAKLHPNLLHPAVGVHPQEGDFDDGILETLLKKHPEVVAVGECGLEFVDIFDQDGQIKNFRKQIELANKYDKAVIIHSRKAAEETLTILRDYKKIRGVVHCYSGGKKRIREHLDISDELFFGIDGNITYEIGLAEVVKEIPKERLVLETDCPFLTPVPCRGQENQPAYVRYIYEKVAEIWEMSFEETEKLIDDNAKKLFNLKNQK